MSPLAFAVIFYAEARRFAAAFPQSHVAACVLRFVTEACPGAKAGRRCKGRDYAVAYYTGPRPEVHFSTRVLALPKANALALIRHELAHAADPTPDAPMPESRADRIAGEVGGQPVRYDRRGVQTLGPGGRRPSGLPR